MLYNATDIAGAVIEAQRLINAGEGREALTLCQKTLKSPGAGEDPRLQAVYATSLSTVGLGAEARKALKKTLRKHPKLPDLHCVVGNTYLTEMEYLEAKRHFAKALELNPKHAMALRCMAGAMISLSEHDAALQLLEGAVRNGVSNLDIQIALTRVLYNSKRYDESIALVDQLIKVEGLSDQLRFPMLFTKADALRGAGRSDEAFAAYTEANRAVGVEHDIEAHAKGIDRLMEVWTPEAVAALPKSNRKSEQIVFIVGMPRSGTSLVEQIIASHPRAFGAGELRHMADIVTQIVGGTREITGGLFDLSRLSAKNIDNASAHYLSQVTSLAPGAERISDKMPGNYISLGLIGSILPNCKIIHCVRDARDTCLSCYFNYFRGKRITFAYDLEDLGSYFNDYWRMMKHWKSVLDVPIMDVVYEDLISDQEAQSRRLIDFIGLDWDDRCLEFYKTKRVTKTLSADQVNKPIYRSSMSRWKPFESHLEPLLKRLPADALRD